MVIIQVKTGNKTKVETTSIGRDEIKRLPKSRYSFDWSRVDKGAVIFVLIEVETGDILGAIAILKFPEEFRYEIKLLAVSKENIGSKKVYEGIAGCLIAFSCKECMKEYGPWACVSMIPKTRLKRHYILKYGMNDAGRQIYLSDLSLMKIINDYYL